MLTLLYYQADRAVQLYLNHLELFKCTW